jgi:group II intron reverse transcriptase/maturase
MPERSSSDSVSTKLQRIAELARQSPDMVFTTLAHHIDIEFLLEACRRTRKDGAVGVDGQTAREYAENLEENLRSLLDRFKSGRYRAPPVRRGYVPKGDGESQRPIGIPTFEDKALQRAVVMVLNAVYEQDFRDCSFGFRPDRSAHMALEVLWKGLMKMGGGWVLSLDIRSFFDTLDKKHLRSFLDLRVRDGVIRRTIDKWLAAGVMEEGQVVYPDSGSPQGGVISPILANVYLHEVLDKWFEDVVRPRLEGEAFLIRYADDATLVLSCERDARRVLAVLPKRFEKYGLSLHPEKTRLIDFQRPSGRVGKDEEDKTTRSSTFDLLGFRHYWGRSRRGSWVVKRKTSKKRFRRAVRTVAVWCRRFRHEPVWWQHQKLCQKLHGHNGYYGITGNGRALECFLHAVKRIWQKWLSRRSQRAYIRWDRFLLFLRRYPLPPARVVHSVYRRVANP